jgi:hypothetical protein
MWPPSAAFQHVFDNTLYYFSESTLGSQVRYHSELTSRPSLSTAAPATAATSAAH